MKSKPRYSTLQWKIFLRVALFAGIAIIIVAVLLSFANFRFANWFVSFLQRAFSLDFREAHRIYIVLIRNNIDLVIYATFGVFFIVLIRFLMVQFAKYFNEISNGLDALVENKSDEIKLSPEMESMEQKLKSIQQTLIKREQEAKVSEQRKNDVVMYLAHDIRTPLTSVIGYLSLLDEAEDMHPAQKKKYISITLEKANRLERLVNEFFEISRLNFQGKELAKESIDLYYMLVQMTDEFYPLLTAKGKEIKLNVPDELRIYGNPDGMARVFDNILKNAIAYSADGGVIEITAVATDDTVSIAFKNHGGIPKEKLSFIFEKFYRLDYARSSDTGGAGLGLAIAKEIILAHGGEIKAHCDDGFTIFTVTLPSR